MTPPEGSGDVQINEWMIAYKSPTINTASTGIPLRYTSSYFDFSWYNLLGNNWYQFEGQDKLNRWTVAAMKDLSNIVAEVNQDELGQLTNGEGRYWVAVGPGILLGTGYDNKNYYDSEHLPSGLKFDCVLVNSKDEKFYLPCVQGCDKEHTYPDGIYQTGFHVETHKDVNGNLYKPLENGGLPNADFQDFSIIEFVGWDPNNKALSDNIKTRIKKNLENYKLVDIIMYDDPNIKYKSLK